MQHISKAQKAILRLKELTGRSSRERENGLTGYTEELPPISNATSKPAGLLTRACPYNECDGSGIIWTGVNDTKFCRCYKSLISENRMKFAKIPEEFRGLKINDFQTDIYTTEENRETARRAKLIAIGYIKDFKSVTRGLYMYSAAAGSGKTRMLASLGNALVNICGAAVRFITTGALLDEIRSTFNPDSTDSFSSVMEDIKKVDVLMLDDMGAEKPTKWVSEVFYNILNARMTSGKITLFTSNYAIEELDYDRRIIDRVLKMAMPLKFPDESIRAQIARTENDGMMKRLIGVD